MRARKAVLALTLLMMPLLISGLVISQLGEIESATQSSPERINMLSYEEHAPIVILNDTDFHEIADTELWDGLGSEQEPYIIEGYNITADTDCIKIDNVSLYFEIRDCYLNSINPYYANGVLLKNVTNGLIADTIMTNKTRGVNTDSCDSLVFSNIDIFDCSWEGMILDNSDFCNVTGSRIHDNGGAGMSFYNSHNCTITLNEVYGNQATDTGIHLSSSENATIIDNEIHDNLGAGLYLSSSSFAFIQGNDVWNNSDVGILISNSQNCTVASNDVWESGFWGTYSRPAGISFLDTQYSKIENNRVWNNSFTGISLDGESDANDILENSIWNNTDHGIHAYDSFGINVIDNEIWGNGWSPSPPACGIYVQASVDWYIENNRIWNNTQDGIHFTDGSGSSTIANNKVFNNTRSGISLSDGGPYFIDSNIAHHNIYGIYVYVDNPANITNNIIYDNELGIFLENSVDSWIYGNDMGWNTLLNAADPAGFDVNTWHDNVSIGNWWSDYSGQGYYNITAISADDAQDIYPRKSLDLNASAPIAFEITETGNIMSWEAHALNPSHYEVYANETLLYNVPWDGGDIETNLDGLSAGYHEISVFAYHTSGHSTTETADAVVTDSTAPTWIVGPSDQVIDEGQSLSAQFSAEDPSGIDTWWVNDTVNFHITSTGLLTNNTALSIPGYGLRVYVNDTFGNTNDYEIHIQVLYVPPVTTTTTTTTTTETTTTTITTTFTPPPPIDGTLILVLGVGGGAVVVIVIVMIIRKRPGQ